MSGEKYLLTVWAETESGEKLYPYTGVKGAKKGLFSVSFTGKSSEYEGVSEEELISAIESGLFAERGTIRMLHLNSASGSNRNGFAPTHYNGLPIKEAGKSSAKSSKILKITYPDELSPNTTYSEGTTRQILVNAYERSSLARDQCIKQYGAICAACDMNFEKIYGAIGIGFIHVHHTTPISTIGSAYEVDPIKNLIPVCPNCHAMLHREDPPLTIQELKLLITRNIG